MRNLCGLIVTSLGSLWGVIGWVLFLGAFAIPMLACGSAVAMLVAWNLGALTLLWWAIDVVDQCVSWWVIAVGAAMLIAGIYAPILTLAAWVVYWTRVRG